MQITNTKDLMLKMPSKIIYIEANWYGLKKDLRYKPIVFGKVLVSLPMVLVVPTQTYMYCIALTSRLYTCIFLRMCQITSLGIWIKVLSKLISTIYRMFSFLLTKPLLQPPQINTDSIISIVDLSSITHYSFCDTLFHVLVLFISPTISLSNLST